ncbi:hypothetical protein [Microbulbifer rhizosphaerae]|uniref:Uncharacterized protein n=1 Tax=Microbulbifer rhizosphaerae TaxID=1562603 RepID=A0A7W4WA80_9GAMM|nr:hypothetical protein [Microbulbifer rhizosphaerae]MBB3060526.1 hypothetical protein [Microbulbifer rhizosphaerae]
MASPQPFRCGSKASGYYLLGFLLAWAPAPARAAVPIPDSQPLATSGAKFYLREVRREQELYLEIFLDDESTGLIAPVLLREGRLWISSADLREIGLRIPRGSAEH